MKAANSLRVGVRGRSDGRCRARRHKVWNAGIGLEFPLQFGYGPAWFIEARYHHISTPMSTEYIPIEIGLRY
jgi:hypothetical protein